jgi:hypothetical protein
VGNALEQKVCPGLASLVIEEEHGAAQFRERLLQSKYLPSITQRIMGDHAKLGKRIQYKPLGVEIFYLFQKVRRCFG